MTLSPHHLPLLHHVHRTLVYRAVSLVSEPVLVALREREGEREGERGREREIRIRIKFIARYAYTYKELSLVYDGTNMNNIRK